VEGSPVERGEPKLCGINNVKTVIFYSCKNESVVGQLCGVFGTTKTIGYGNVIKNTAKDVAIN
jgi:hypothetical protein